MLQGLIILHVVVCILLTVVVLLQFGKGAEAGAMMGSGSSQAIFTSSAKGNFFTKMTTVLAIAFMVNSVALTILTSKNATDSLLDGEAPVAAPLNNDAAIEAAKKVEAKAKAAATTATKKVEAVKDAAANKAKSVKEAATKKVEALKDAATKAVEN